MSTRRTFLAGAAAIALLAGVALAVIWWSGSGRRSSDDTPLPTRSPVTATVPSVPGTAEPTTGAVVAVAGTPSLPATPAPEPDIVQARPHRPASAAAHIEWEQVPTVARVGQLGPAVSGAVLRGLRAARAQMDTCFSDEARRLARGSLAIDPEEPPTGPARLMLLLESRPGGIDVVDTQVVSVGTSTPQLVECVQQVLKGWPMPAPGSPGGRRYRLRYTVQ